MNKKITVFSAHDYDQKSFEEENKLHNFELEFLACRLDAKTADLLNDARVVCAFTNDDLSRSTLTKLKDKGIKLIALRCAGFNNVDIEAAKELGIEVIRVPSYSPNAVAEHAVALILALNRKIHKAYNRTREGNFDIHGLMGFDLYQKNIGLIGMGQIGAVMSKILNGFGSNVLVYDPHCETKLPDVKFVSLPELLRDSDIISLHCPLTADTKHLINDATIKAMKVGVMLINTSRGAVIDTKAVIRGLKSQHIGYLGLDVYEEEANVFFKDLSEETLQDDSLARLLTFPNVIITSHQGFFTQEAITNIAKTSFENINIFFESEQNSREIQSPNLVTR